MPYFRCKRCVGLLIFTLLSIQVSITYMYCHGLDNKFFNPDSHNKKSFVTLKMSQAILKLKSDMHFGLHRHNWFWNQVSDSIQIKFWNKERHRYVLDSSSSLDFNNYWTILFLVNYGIKIGFYILVYLHLTFMATSTVGLMLELLFELGDIPTEKFLCQTKS